jgi:hypothetical protein
LANALADLTPIFGTHVLAILRGCAFWTDNATFAVANRHGRGPLRGTAEALFAAGRLFLAMGMQRSSAGRGDSAPPMGNDSVMADVAFDHYLRFF